MVIISMKIFTKQYMILFPRDIKKCVKIKKIEKSINILGKKL